MSHQPVTPEERFAAVIAGLGDNPDVSYPSDGARATTMFGASALKIRNRIFAMLVGGRIVVKLPRQRVDALIASGGGERFDPGHGRLMKEWVAVEPTAEEDWMCLAREAMAYVESGR
jgi:hypothetical protein